MKLIIQTQIYENYGTRWKPKGGTTYQILNVPKNIDLEALVHCAVGIEVDNDIVREEVIDWYPESDDYITDSEQCQIEFEGKVIFPDPRMEYSELVEFTQ
jgi:hypothetical protein